MSTLRTWCELKDDGGVLREYEVEVDFTYFKATRGARDSLCGVRGAGPPLEPDETARVEVNSATNIAPNTPYHGIDYWNDLEEKEQDRITERCMESIADSEQE